jgi:hypothetical protein
MSSDVLGRSSFRYTKDTRTHTRIESKHTTGEHCASLKTFSDGIHLELTAIFTIRKRHWRV